ncbi:MAG TPA: efflux RND transporter periplasmic adaptor subunit [Opitutaceae bacterium]|nr:efflux RND transporter periplasmic adaptor subunit [Opitutaceae bacterium]
MSAPNPTTPTPAPRRKKKTKLYVIIGLVVVVIALTGVGLMKGRGEKATSVTTEKSIRKTVTQVVSATGRIQPEVEVKISAEVSGEIIDLPVVEGQEVKRGDLITKLKPDFYAAQVEQQQATVASARARVVQNEAQAEKAGFDFAQIDSLFTKGLISETEFNASRSANRVAAANLEAARAEIERAEGSLRQAQDQLSKTSVYAPMDGTISVLNSKLGERVVATAQFTGTEILRVADLSTMEVRVNVNENDVINVKVGDSAAIRVDAFQDRAFTGEVREIANSAKTSGQGSQDEVTNFEVRIRVLDKEGRLRPGMSATADIKTKTVENVVAVPIQSVTVRTSAGAKTAEELQRDREAEAAKTRGEGAANVVDVRVKREQERADRAALDRIVFVLEGDKVVLRKVETGIMDNTHIEITSGLDEGVAVVSGPYNAITRTLKDGMKVMAPPAKTAAKTN